jgi:hypothetical protein
MGGLSFDDSVDAAKKKLGEQTKINPRSGVYSWEFQQLKLTIQWGGGGEDPGGDLLDETRLAAIPGSMDVGAERMSDGSWRAREGEHGPGAGMLDLSRA